MTKRLRRLDWVLLFWTDEGADSMGWCLSIDWTLDTCKSLAGAFFCLLIAFWMYIDLAGSINNEHLKS
jgi:hypothetical protein